MTESGACNKAAAYRLHLHKWTPWSEPYAVNIHYHNSGRPLAVLPSRRQRRTCVRCGKVKEREAQ